MDKLRSVTIYGEYFEEFYKNLDEKVQEKVDLGIYHLQYTRRVPSKFIGSTKHKNLFYLRIKQSSNIYRIFFCYDEGKLVIIFNGFQKKSKKTPKAQIKRALKIKKQYFDEKE